MIGKEIPREINRETGGNAGREEIWERCIVKGKISQKKKN